MKKITVLGAGLIGRTIAIDLQKVADVTAVDRDPAVLSTLPQTIRKSTLDLSGDLGPVLQNADMVVCALPGFLGYNAMRQIITAKKDVVDISFFKEDPFSLDFLAKENGVRAIIDAGVAPGMCNLILGHVFTQLDSTNSYECYVGGLPFAPKPPFNYKSPFCPDDVIQEYMRPARFVKDGIVDTCYPLTTKMQVISSPVGNLEAFTTDGLRSLVTTMVGKVPNMVEKTCRFPGHVELMKQMGYLGFFEEAALPVTTKMLKAAWKLDPSENEFTFMRVIVKGQREKRPVEITYNLFDRFDPKTGFSSMARTTGFTVNALVNLILNGTITTPGILAPEIIGQDQKVFDGVLSYLTARNVVYKVVG